jgi:hypothetical protein
MPLTSHVSYAASRINSNLKGSTNRNHAVLRNGFCPELSRIDSEADLAAVNNSTSVKISFDTSRDYSPPDLLFFIKVSNLPTLPNHLALAGRLLGLIRRQESRVRDFHHS